MFAPSTRMVRFTGEFDFPVKFVKYYKDEPRIVLKKDDVLVLPAPTAMKVSRKSNFELVTFEKQAELLGQSTTEAKAEAEAKALEEAEKAKAEAEAKAKAEVTVIPEATVTPESIVTPEVVITKENVMDESLVTLPMIKALCKQHNITIGKKKRDVLISLLLPFLG